MGALDGTGMQQAKLASVARRDLGAYALRLALTQKTYQETGKGLSRGAIQKLLPQLKKEHEWLTEPYSQCLQVVALNLSNAFIT